MYYPWIKVSDPATDKIISIPPSGHIAGVWARNDTTSGVHKAPANEIVSLAVGLSYQTTKGEQDTLNPIGVNCIRAFPGRGIRVWGARTLSSDPAWRYINVRRLYNYVEKSIENGTQWVVFEPNDRSLWSRVDRDMLVQCFLQSGDPAVLPHRVCRIVPMEQYEPVRRHLDRGHSLVRSDDNTLRSEWR